MATQANTITCLGCSIISPAFPLHHIYMQGTITLLRDIAVVCHVLRTDPFVEWLQCSTMIRGNTSISHVDNGLIKRTGAVVRH